MYGPPRTIAANRSSVLVDVARCAGCGLCVRTCPAGALVLDDGSGAVQVDEDACGGCYKCVRRCPTHALSMHWRSLV